MGRTLTGHRTTTPDPRDIYAARQEAVDAVTRYAELARAWNAPDDEHTCYQLRRIVDDVIQDVMYDLGPGGIPR